MVSDMLSCESRCSISFRMYNEARAVPAYFLKNFTGMIIMDFLSNSLKGEIVDLEGDEAGEPREGSPDYEVEGEEEEVAGGAHMEVDDDPFRPEVRPIMDLDPDEREATLLKIALKHCHYWNPEKEFNHETAKDDFSKGKILILNSSSVI